MKNLWCWRCKLEIPMLDEEEFSYAQKLYREVIQNTKLTKDPKLRFKPLLEYYHQLTRYEETEPDAIMHHRIALYGQTCEKCGKPYRTPMASFCAACGNIKDKNK
jgi:histone deacetylase complex regulatory component SIN3